MICYLITRHSLARQTVAHLGCAAPSALVRRCRDGAVDVGSTRFSNHILSAVVRLTRHSCFTDIERSRARIFLADAEQTNGPALIHRLLMEDPSQASLHETSVAESEDDPAPLTAVFSKRTVIPRRPANVYSARASLLIAIAIYTLTTQNGRIGCLLSLRMAAHACVSHGPAFELANGDSSNPRP